MAAKKSTTEVTEVGPLTFEIERDTKNTRRFAEVEAVDGSGVIVGTLYVQKHALAKIGNPESVEVIIRAASK